MLLIDDDENDKVRRDINSEEMRSVHPDLPTGVVVDRVTHLIRCDQEAYETIRDKFPGFVPPHRRVMREIPQVPNSYERRGAKSEE